MRPLASLLLPLLLVSGAFAGCLGEDAPDAGDDVAAQEEGASLPTGDEANVTVDDGTTEMPEDLGHQPHLHDYWMGRERVTLMDEDVTVDAFTAFFWTFFDVFRGTPGVGGTYVELPEGQIVYEGTGKLELTVSWTDATITGMGVSYRSAASPDFSQVQPLTQAQPFAIDVTPEMSDMPHEKDSRWAFLLVPASPGQTVVGTFHVKVDIVRMGDIALFPGHPELFNGASTLTLYSGPASSSQTNFATRAVGFLTSPQQEQTSGVASAKVVPMETRSMTANVTITSATTNIGSVSNVTLLYKPADRNFAMRAQTVSADLEKGVFQFAWPVEMRQTDSPYADTSQWRFDLRVQTDPAGMGWETNGLADAKVDYQLEVVAYDSLLPGIEVDEDDDDR